MGIPRLLSKNLNLLVVSVIAALVVMETTHLAVSSRHARQNVCDCSHVVQPCSRAEDPDYDNEGLTKEPPAPQAAPQKQKPQVEPGTWKQHIQERCRDLKLNNSITSLNQSLLNKVLVDDKHQLMYCQMAKVASSTLGKVFAIITEKFNGTNPDSIPSGAIHQVYVNQFEHLDLLPAKDVQPKVSTYYKYMFVRNPFERLISAYRNKFLEPNPMFAYLGRKIVQLFRKHGKYSPTPTFPEFVEYLIDPARKLPLNGHWMPFFDLCRPCEMEYDHVGYLGTINDDLTYILTKRGLEKKMKLPEQPDGHSSLHNTDMYVLKYLMQVPANSLKRLYAMYYKDFYIFNFTLPPEIHAKIQA